MGSIRKEGSKHIRYEDYLVTIYRLKEVFGYARTTDIASELGVTPATVSKVIKGLESKGLVKRIKYKYTVLTEKGKDIAEQIIRKHRIAEAFLNTMLGFDLVESHIYAHSLEHLPDIIIERIYNMLGKPKHCPHGNKIPGIDVEDEAELANLSDVDEGVMCVVKKIAGEFLSALEYLRGIHITLESVFEVVNKDEKAIRVKQVGKDIVEIPVQVARFIFVKCID